MQTVSITRTSSSRATIAAGTRPPRVIATSASNGPDAGEPPGERAGVAVELVPGDRKGFVAAVGHGALRSLASLSSGRCIASRAAVFGGESRAAAGHHSASASGDNTRSERLAVPPDRASIASTAAFAVRDRRARPCRARRSGC